MTLKIDAFYIKDSTPLKYKGVDNGKLLFNSFIRGLDGRWIQANDVEFPPQIKDLLKPSVPPV